jgi:capsular exopolysaccharide synthesis family protein
VFGSHKTIDRRVISLADPTSFEAEQYRRVRHQIEELRAKTGVRTIALTSAVAGDGKTLTSVNLAVTLSRGPGAKVLLIDMDLRRPTVAKVLGMPVLRGGFGTLLENAKASLKDYLQPVPKSSLLVIPTAVTRGDTYELLTSSRFVQLLDEARSQFDYIVLDTPPVIPVPDTTLIHRHVDGYIVVVSANTTPRKLVGEALSLLAPSAVLGIVFNRDDRPMFGYYRGHYRQYFRNYVRAMGERETA